MRLIVYLILIFAVIWFVAAFFNFGNSGNTVVGYSYTDTDHGRIYYRSAYAVSEQRGTVTTEGFGSFTEYENCQVLDLENWLCTYSDNFGFNDGVFRSTINLEQFPHLAYLGETVGVSRFRYMLGSCSVNISAAPISGFLCCATLPFSGW